MGSCIVTRDTSNLHANLGLLELFAHSYHFCDDDDRQTDVNQRPMENQ